MSTPLVLFVGLFWSAAPATSPDPASYVVPVDWRRFDADRPPSDQTVLTARILNTSLRYTLAWAERELRTTPDGKAYAMTGLKETNIRPCASVAIGTAAALKTGVYDEQLTRLPAAEAKARLIRLIGGVVRTHGHNGSSGKGWGDAWQSPLWAALAGQAAWFAWEDLDAETRTLAARMVEFEADRFLRPGYAVPYWNGQGGNTRAEENAWDSMVHHVAVAMMPRHPHAAQWKRIASELMVSSFSTRADAESNTTVVDGRPVKDWLKGYNLRDDGALVNHGIIHDDYMTCVLLCLRAYIVQPFAGQPIPQSARFNADLIYRTLVTRKWPSPPYQPPGGTMYVPGQADVYYPEGTDWSRFRYPVFYELDTFAHLLRFDQGLPHRAAEWMPLRVKRMVEMQARHDDGHMFAPGEFNTYRTIEQNVTWTVADTLLLNWLHDRDALRPEANWNQE